jgi:8-oxo-dGTP diphosphatase
VGQRKGSHGAGTWHLPGGHLEMYETPLETALREVAEEAGISIENVRLTGIYTDDPMPQWHRHYITLYVVSDWKEGEPRILEPEKCAEWRWCRWNEIPRPLFPSLENVLKKGYSPFEWH